MNINTLAISLFISLLYSCASNELPDEVKAIKSKSENEIKKWIKNHALYPDSYEPKSFSEFSQSYGSRNGDKIPNSDNYVIKHIHQLLNTDSMIETFSGYFILENNFDVNIIEIERSTSIGGAYPPKTKIWLDKFGRPENSDDSLHLEKKESVHKKRIIKEIQISIDEANVKSGNVEDLQNLIDTL